VTDSDDDPLMADLRRLLDIVEPVSGRSLELARAAFDWRTMDAELAELVADSSLAGEHVAVRAEGQPRLVTFEHGTDSIELEIHERGEARLIVGQLDPERAADVTLVRPGGERERTRADATGRFSFELAAGGPAMLEALSLRTDWLVI
jgi:hypothetical protein